MWQRVIGQQRVKNILVSALRAQRLPHAYLFAGNEGVGKDAMALELARVVHCAKKELEACNECASCRSMDSLQHPDVKFITALPTGKNEKGDDPPLEKLAPADVQAIQEQYSLKAKNPYHRITIPRAHIIKISSVREVRRQTAMSSLYEGKKVFILSGADEMGEEAANTLLKTLEEPPGDTLLILTTARPELLPQTIVSRCQFVRFDPLTEEEIQAALVARAQVGAERASLVARLANGSYVRALELLDTDLDALRREVVDFLRAALANNVVSLSEHIERLAASKDREFVVRFLTLMLIWFRDAFVLARGGEIINLDQQDDLQRFVARFGSADLQRVLEGVEHAISLLYKNGYIHLVLLQLVVKLRRAIVETAAQPA